MSPKTGFYLTKKLWQEKKNQNFVGKQNTLIFQKQTNKNIKKKP